MTLEDRVQALRLLAFRRADELKNVSAACRELGLSRSLFYRWKQRFERYGPDGLHPRRTRARRGRPPAVPAQVERAVVALALAWPTWGPNRLAVQLAHQQGIEIAPSTAAAPREPHATSAWSSSSTTARKHRTALSEPVDGSKAKAPTSPRRGLRRASSSASINTWVNSGGKVGRSPPVTRPLHAMACVFVQRSPRPARSRFLRHVLVPHSREAGWPIQRVLTDRGSEFAGAFAQSCRELGVRHTQTKPRHAWTNGFVERLQGTILHEHWRVEFRRRYFTQLSQLQRSLDSFLRFYNHERPHHGYRTRGRTPAAILLGAQER
jgi:transposase InsO family protein